MGETKFLVIYEVDGITQHAVMTAEAIFSTMDMEKEPGDIKIDVYKLGGYGTRPERCVFLGKMHDSSSPQKMMIIGEYGIVAIGWGTER